VSIGKLVAAYSTCFERDQQADENAGESEKMIFSLKLKEPRVKAPPP
jgi:hypothetical protein